MLMIIIMMMIMMMTVTPVRPVGPVGPHGPHADEVHTVSNETSDLIQANQILDIARVLLAVGFECWKLINLVVKRIVF